jgi:hypothetical protein
MFGLTAICASTEPPEPLDSTEESVKVGTEVKFAPG